jgi:hypothetical protein
LTKPGIAPNFGTRQKSIDFRLGFQLANDSGERSTIVMQFGFFHAALTDRIAEELEHDIERLRSIVHDVRKGLPLTVCQKIFPSHFGVRHPELHTGWLLSESRRCSAARSHPEKLHPKEA